MGAKRAAELHRAESEAVAETIRGTREFFQSGATVRVEQIELFRAMREAAQADSEEADLAAMVAMLPEEILENGENVSVEACWLGERFRARVRVEADVPDRQRQGARGQPCFAQTLAGLLREMTQHCGEHGGVIGVLAESVILRDGFRLCVRYKFVGIPA